MDPLEMQIEEALHEMPLQPLPAGFTRRVMAQVWAAADRPRPRFRLEFVDVSIPAFVAFFVTSLGAAGAWLWLAADPFLAAKAQLWFKYFWMQVSTASLFPVALAGAAGVACLVVGVLCLGLLLEGARRAV